MKKRESACRVRRELEVIAKAEGELTARIDGRIVMVPAGKAAPELVPGDYAVWDGGMWRKGRTDDDAAGQGGSLQ